MTNQRHNPFIVLSPCCGELMCYRCVALEEKINAGCDCDNCAGCTRRTEKALAKHRAEMEHTRAGAVPAAEASK